MKRRILLMLSLGLFAFTFGGCNSSDMKDYEPTPYADIQFSKNIKLLVKETDITTDTKKITLVFENLTNKIYCKMGSLTVHLNLNVTQFTFVTFDSQYL